MRFALLSIVGIVCCLSLQGQLLSSTPNFIRENTSGAEIILDATKGNQALFNISNPSDVYVHIGVITSKSTSATDWKYVKFAWGVANPAAACVSMGNNKWKYVISGNLRTFFGITDATESIKNIAILFRSGNGNTVHRNADQSDMYLPVYPTSLQVRIAEPPTQPLFLPTPETITKGVGDAISISAISSETANISISLNGVGVANQNNVTQLTANPTISAGGPQKIIATASDGTITIRDSLTFFVSNPPAVLPLPSGVKDGINYEPGDNAVTLVLFAPQKNSVFVIGEFNNWTQQQDFQMNKTPDGNRHWIRITGLQPGREYAYQYLVDGALKIADYNTEKILDPNNDNFIPASTFPNLKAYPVGKTTGIVSVLQTAKPTYSWQVANFTRPDKRNLVIYELLLRDFLAQPNWKTLKDTLTYIKRLGVNALHLMPFSEFEGNISWGYNPSFFFAPDKYYGTENDLKAFIDECHKQGIAVIMDMVLNHAFGQSPMVQLYFDAATSKPSASSPWFNPDARHPFNVGYDFNHESQATKDLVDRVVEHWLTNYKIDGFRWDLSKGFTQTNNPSNVSAWGAYDASRIAIWKRINQKMQAVAPGSYCILEHFADNSEEKELADAGMLLWGNANFNFNEATMGYLPGSNFESVMHTKRNWTQPHLIGYQESHDEERLMYKNLNFGNGSGAYNIRDLATALKRNEMAAAFWSMIPGPKLMWQFGELGYDFSITYCPSTTSVPTPYPNMQCRTDPKPIRWDYRNDPARNKLFLVYSSLIKLRLTPDYSATFTGASISADLASAGKWMIVQGPNLNVVVVGNFDLSPRAVSVTFPKAGSWYSYLDGSMRNATGSAESITLQPGDYYVFTDKNIAAGVITSIHDLRPDFSENSLIIHPNPVRNQSWLTYALPTSGKVSVQVWSMQGEKIGEKNLGMQPKGRHQLSLQESAYGLSRALPGQYLLILDIDGRKIRKPFIIQP